MLFKGEGKNEEAGIIWGGGRVGGGDGKNPGFSKVFQQEGHKVGGEGLDWVNIIALCSLRIQ